MRNVKALLINPYQCTVTPEVLKDNDSPDSLKNYYALLSTDKIEVLCLDSVSIGEGVFMFIDDEGLLKEEGQRYFFLDGQLFAGKGILTGIGSQGETIDCPITMQDLSGRIGWIKEGIVPNVPPPQVISLEEGESFDDAMKRLKPPTITWTEKPITK